MLLYSKKEVKTIAYYFNTFKSKCQHVPSLPLTKVQDNTSLDDTSPIIKHKQPSYSSLNSNRTKPKLPKSLQSNRSMTNLNTNNNSINTNNNSNNNNNRTIRDFILRQDKYLQIHNNEQAKIRKDNEEEYDLICTFNPKIHKNPNVHNYFMPNQTSTHQRLYNDSVERKNRKHKLEQELINKFKSNKLFDQDKFDNLYEDYKVRQQYKKRLTCQLDQERGYTYTPDICGKGIYSYTNYNKINNSISCHSNNNNNNRTNNSSILNQSKVSVKSGNANNSVDYTNNSTCDKHKSNKSAISNKKEFSFIYEYIRNKNK